MAKKASTRKGRPARKRVEPVKVVEEKFGLPEGSLNTARTEEGTKPAVQVRTLDTFHVLDVLPGRDRVLLVAGMSGGVFVAKMDRLPDEQAEQMRKLLATLGPGLCLPPVS